MIFAIRKKARKFGHFLTPEAIILILAKNAIFFCFERLFLFLSTANQSRDRGGVSTSTPVGGGKSGGPVWARVKLFERRVINMR